MRVYIPSATNTTPQVEKKGQLTESARRKKKGETHMPRQGKTSLRGSEAEKVLYTKTGKRSWSIDGAEEEENKMEMGMR